MPLPGVQGQLQRGEGEQEASREGEGRWRQGREGTLYTTVYTTVYTSLLHPQHLGGIWIGLNQYRLPLAPLNEYPKPWC